MEKVSKLRIFYMPNAQKRQGYSTGKIPNFLKWQFLQENVLRIAKNSKLFALKNDSKCFCSHLQGFKALQGGPKEVIDDDHHHNTQLFHHYSCRVVFVTEEPQSLLLFLAAKIRAERRFSDDCQITIFCWRSWVLLTDGFMIYLKQLWPQGHMRPWFNTQQNIYTDIPLKGILHSARFATFL